MLIPIQLPTQYSTLPATKYDIVDIVVFKLYFCGFPVSQLLIMLANENCLGKTLKNMTSDLFLKNIFG